MKNFKSIATSILCLSTLIISTTQNANAMQENNVYPVEPNSNQLNSQLTYEKFVQQANFLENNLDYALNNYKMLGIPELKNFITQYLLPQIKQLLKLCNEAGFSWVAGEIIVNQEDLYNKL